MAVWQWQHMFLIYRPILLYWVYTNVFFTLPDINHVSTVNAKIVLVTIYANANHCGEERTVLSV